MEWSLKNGRNPEALLYHQAEAQAAFIVTTRE